MLIPWNSILGWLDADEVWERHTRSRELTPLYVKRYRGPNTSPVLGHHEFWELIYVFKGNGIFHGAEPQPFRTGKAFLVPPGVAHREETGDADALWIGLRGTLLDDLTSDRLYSMDGSDLALLLEQLWICAERRQRKAGPELDGLARAAVARMLRLIAEKHRPSDSLLDGALQHLQRNFMRPVSISALAARLGYSDGYFFRAFKRCTGTTPSAYVTRLRIEHAAKLLRHSALSVSRVAKHVGYADPLYFSRTFKKVTGHSPRALRNLADAE